MRAKTLLLSILFGCFSYAAIGKGFDGSSRFKVVFKMRSTKPKDFFGSPLQADLAEAISKGDTNKIGVLIFKGADVNYSGNNGMNPLFWALVNKKIKVFKFLLDNGANPDAVVKWNPPNLADSALTLAAGLDDPKYLEELLKHGANPNLTDWQDGQTAIFNAALNEQTNNILILLKHRADINATNSIGQTVMHKAVNSSRYAMALFLYRAGADPLIKNDTGMDVIDTIKRFPNVTFTRADRDAYPRLLEELKMNDLIDGEFIRTERIREFKTH